MNEILRSQPQPCHVFHFGGPEAALINREIPPEKRWREHELDWQPLIPAFLAEAFIATCNLHGPLTQKLWSKVDHTHTRCALAEVAMAHMNDGSIRHVTRSNYDAFYDTLGRIRYQVPLPNIVYTPGHIILAPSDYEWQRRAAAYPSPPQRIPASPPAASLPRPVMPSEPQLVAAPPQMLQAQLRSGSGPPSTVFPQANLTPRPHQPPMAPQPQSIYAVREPPTASHPQGPPPRDQPLAWTAAPAPPPPPPGLPPKPELEPAPEDEIDMILEQGNYTPAGDHPAAPHEVKQLNEIIAPPAGPQSKPLSRPLSGQTAPTSVDNDAGMPRPGMDAQTASPVPGSAHVARSTTAEDHALEAWIRDGLMQNVSMVNTSNRPTLMLSPQQSPTPCQYAAPVVEDEHWPAAPPYRSASTGSQYSLPSPFYSNPSAGGHMVTPLPSAQIHSITPQEHGPQSTMPSQRSGTALPPRAYRTRDSPLTVACASASTRAPR